KTSPSCSANSGNPLNVLILSVSAKGGLVKAFRESSNANRIVGVDADAYAPAGQLCDRFYTIPKQTHPTCLEKIQALCQRESIDLIIPTREDDIAFLNQNPNVFQAKIATCSSECFHICNNKWETQAWLTKHNFQAPPTLRAEYAKADMPFTEFPLIAKSPTGSGSRGIEMLKKPQDIRNIPDHWLIQPLLNGNEYTLNAYVDMQGHCVTLIPHARIRVQEGEVSQGLTVRNQVLIELGTQIAEALPGAYGPMTIQVFFDTLSSHLAVTDINPRFGGGYPLVHRSGARFTEWLIQEAQGMTLPHPFTAWENNLMILRYRESLFFKKDAPGPNSPSESLQHLSLEKGP
ncbi:MAG TPA: hypothetical protein DIU37_04345, partial [Opitutae bacterium]|nr:hypothetical protein [Opitutae bacterium]